MNIADYDTFTVRSFGIIGGGALLFAASGLGGLGQLGETGPFLLITYIHYIVYNFIICFLAALVGTLGAGGAGASFAMCTGPIFCRATSGSGQCCMVIASTRGLRCPRAC